MPDSTQRLPLIQPLEQRNALQNVDRKIINGLVENTTDTPRLRKRSGLLLSFTGTPGKGQGITNYENSVYSISGDTLNQFGGTASSVAIQATAAASFQPRVGSMAVGFNGKLYVMGGWVSPAVAIPTFTCTIAGGSIASITTTYAGVGYAPGYPTTLNLIFSGGGGASAAATVTISGQSVSGNPTITNAGTGYTSPPSISIGTTGWGIMNDVWTSVDGVHWTQITGSAPWGQRGQGSAIVFKGKLYVIGGATGTTPNLDTMYNDVWSTSDGITWAKSPNSPWAGRFRFGVCVWNSKLWIAGGKSYIYHGNPWPNTYYSDVWSSSDGGTWVNSTVKAPWIPRANFALYGLGSNLYLVGGQLTDPFVNATSDSWSSPDGTTWTQTSSNPFGVAASGVWPIAAITSQSSFLTEPPPVTISGGTGGSGATAFCTIDVDDVGDDNDECQSGSLVQVTFGAVGSGYTGAPTVSFGTTVGAPNLNAYAMLDGTSNGGNKQLRSDIIGGTVYILEYDDTGTFVHTVWSTTNGTTFTNLNVNFTAGWIPRAGEWFAYGNLWQLGGLDASNNYYNDVWFISLSGGTFALGPTVANGFYHFTQTSLGIATPLLVFKSTGDLYSFNAALNVLTKLTSSANYPAVTVPGIVYLDGYFIVMDPNGNIWNSSANAPGTWNALGFIAMQNEPNGGVAIAKLQNYVVGFGQWTTEWFYDGPAPGAPPASPLLPNTTLPFQVGCAAGESVIECQNSVVWIGQTRREGQGVYMFQNDQPVRISTPFIDDIIQSDPLVSVNAFTQDIFGHSCYILNLNTVQATLVFDFTTQVWSTWTSLQTSIQFNVTSLTCDPYGTVTAIIPNHSFADGDPATISSASTLGYNGLVNVNVIDPNTVSYQVGSALAANAGTALAQSYSTSFYSYVASAQVQDVDYVQDPLNGNIYSNNNSAVTDNGNPIDLQCITERWDGGSSMWKFLRRASVLADINASNVLLAYSDNDYQSYSKFRTLNLTQGQRATTVNCGRFRVRAFKLKHTASTPFRASVIELEIIPGDF